MMKLNRKKRRVDGIPTASMSDISFCLLVFFLATTKFDIKKGIGLVLPPASEKADIKAKLKKENVAKIDINKEGVVALNGETIKYNDIEGRIKKMVLDNPDLVISLRTDRQSKYSNMIRALDKIKAAGAEKISLATN